MDVYLCINMENTNKYNCKKFNDYLEANEYFRLIDKSKIQHSTMIPVFMLLPNIIKKKYLTYELSKIFCKTEIE
jgi:hypothetical protein